MSIPDRARTRALVFLAFGVLTSGISAVLIRLCAFPSGLVATLRMALAGLALLPFVAGGLGPIARKIGARRLVLLAVPGILLGIHFQLWVAGVRQATVAAATFIFAVNPVLFALVEIAVYRRRLAATDWIALALVLAGGTWLLAAHPAGPAGSAGGLGGILLVFASTAVFVAYLVTSQKLSTGVPHPTYLCLICLSGALVTLPFALAGGAAAMAPWGDGRAWLALAALALLPTLVGHGSNTYAVRFFPPLLVSFTTLLEPLLSTLAAFLVLAERPPAAEVPAYALFAAATALFLGARWARERRHKQEGTVPRRSSGADDEGTRSNSNG